jgi:hypothetical protein
MAHVSGASKDAPSSTYQGLNHGRDAQATDASSGGVFLRRPVSTDTRLILTYRPALCCSSGAGLELPDGEKVPAPLLARGVTEVEWRQFLEGLEADVQPLNCSVCSQVLAWISICGLLCWCSRLNAHQLALGAWVKDLNSRVLEPRGMFAKFQTSQINANKYREEISWLAIAIGEAEVESLQQEPVFWKPACCTHDMVRDECATSCAACCGRTVV